MSDKNSKRWAIPPDEKLPPVPIAERGRTPAVYLRYLAREIRILANRTPIQQRWLQEWDRNFGPTHGPTETVPPLLSDKDFVARELSDEPIDPMLTASSPLPPSPSSSPPPPSSVPPRRRKANAGAANRVIEETISRRIQENESDASTDEEDPRGESPPPRSPPPPGQGGMAPTSPYGRMNPAGHVYPPQPNPYLRRPLDPYSQGRAPDASDGFAPPEDDEDDEDDESEEKERLPVPLGHTVDGAFLTHVQSKLSQLTEKVVDVMKTTASMAHQSAEESRRNATLIIDDSRANARASTDNADRLAASAIRIVEGTAASLERLSVTMSKAMDNFSSATEKLIGTLDRRVQMGEEAQIKAMKTHADSITAMAQAAAKEYRADAIMEAHGAVEPEEDPREGMVTAMLGKILSNGIGGAVEQFSQIIATNGADMTKEAVKETVNTTVRDTLRDELHKIFSAANLSKK